MDFLTIIDLVSSLTVIAGVFFALLEFRNYKAAHKRESALTLMQSFMSPEYNEVIPIVFDMPEGLSPDEIVKAMGGKSKIFNFLSTFESLGVLVYHRVISLDLADDYFSSPVLAAWRKLGPSSGNGARKMRDLWVGNGWSGCTTGWLKKRAVRPPSLPT